MFRRMAMFRSSYVPSYGSYAHLSSNLWCHKFTSVTDINMAFLHIGDALAL